jgi:hypothetical protein
VANRDRDDFGNVLSDIFRESSRVMAVCLVLGLLAGLGVAAWIVWSWPVLETRAERRIQSIFAGGVVVAGLVGGLVAGLVVGSLLDAVATAMGKGARPPKKRRRRRLTRRPPDHDERDDDAGLFRPLPPG